MLVLGHRGARWRALENTVAALRIAYEEGADGVEFDVQVSKDREPVLFHDDSLAAMTGRDAEVSALPLRELTQLEVRDRHGHHGRIEHLDAALELLLGRGGVCNLELKVVGDSGPYLVDAVVRRLQAAGLLTSVRPTALGAAEPAGHGPGWVISSFHRRTLERCVGAGLTLDLAALIDEEACDFAPLAGVGDRAVAALAVAASSSHGGLRAIHPHHSLVDAARLELWRSAGCQVRPWTVNAPTRWAQLREAGLDALITDDPGGARAYLDRAAP